jgi:hypothetical protein
MKKETLNKSIGREEKSDMEIAEEKNKEKTSAEKIFTVTHQVLENVDNNLKEVVNSGKTLKEEFPKIPKVAEMVNITDIEAFEAARNSKKDILSRLRDGSFPNKLAKTAMFAGTLLSVENSLHAQNIRPTNEDAKMEISILDTDKRQNPTPDSYDVRELFNRSENNQKNIQNNPEACRQMISSAIEASKMMTLTIERQNIDKKWWEINQLTLELEKKLNSIPNKNSSEYKNTADSLKQKNVELELIGEESKYKTTLLNKIVSGESSDLEAEKEKYKKNAPELIKQVEAARENVIKIISSDDYLEKIQKEFNCRREEAEKHQKIRISNVRLANCTFKSKKELELSMGCAAAYNHNHTLLLPYDESSEKISDLATHEFFHSSTIGNDGISLKAREILEKSFKNYSDYSKHTNDYLSNPTERYVRLKLLDMELDRLNIKKIGEKFTKKHYDKMMKIFNDNSINKEDSLDENAKELIKTTIQSGSNYEDIKQLIDEIAMNQKNEMATPEKGGNYQYPGWDYNDKNDLA